MGFSSVPNFDMLFLYIFLKEEEEKRKKRKKKIFGKWKNIFFQVTQNPTRGTRKNVVEMNELKSR